MIPSYSMGFFGSEALVDGAVQKEPFMNIIGLTKDQCDAKDITGGYGSGDGAIPKDTDLFRVLYFSFGIGDYSGARNCSVIENTLNTKDDKNLFDKDAKIPDDISNLAKQKGGQIPACNFEVVKWADSHSTKLARALMKGAKFQAAQLYFFQSPTKDCTTGFVSHRIVFLDVSLLNIEYCLGAANGSTSVEKNMPHGYSTRGSLLGGSTPQRNATSTACEVLTFYAQHTWIYTYYYSTQGQITNICKGR